MTSLDIFRLNWILIDTIIIILLILLLIMVKLYKHYARWRSKISNENLVVKSIENEVERTKFRVDFFKKIIFLNHKVSTVRKSPLLLFISAQKRKQLDYAIIEALATYGYPILYVVTTKKIDEIFAASQKSVNFFSNVMKLIKDLQTKNKFTNFNFLLISFFMPFFLSKSLLNSSHFQGSLLINPSFSSNYQLKKQYNGFNTFSGVLHLIFSQYSFPFIPNPSLAVIKNLKNQEEYQQLKVDIIDSARSSFKNFESLLLIKILKIIDDHALSQADVERKNS